MQRALWAAGSGMQAQQLKIDNIANNLANVNTNGFKRSRAEFQDLLYQTMVAPGSRSSSTTRTPTGIQLGMGAKPGAIRKIHSQGEMKRTENQLDVAISGAGFFKVVMPDGTTAYTRDGAFSTNEDGQVVSGQGYQLDPPITLPPDTLTMAIGSDGTVTIMQPGDTSGTELGQIELANFVNPGGLINIGGNLYQPTDASGDPLDSTPGLDGLGTLSQGFIEVSNVQIVEELVEMIATQRAYEFCSRAVKAGDDMMQTANNMAR